MVRYLPQLRVVQQSERFEGDGGEAGGCCFDFEVLCSKLSLHCCHLNASEPVCCVSLTGTSPKKHRPLSSPSPYSCSVSFKAELDSGTFHALAHLTCLASSQDLSNQAQERQRANTGVFNFAPTFSGEKQVCLSIVRLLKLPERQIANIHPLATSMEALCCCLSFISVAGTNFQFVIL